MHTWYHLALFVTFFVTAPVYWTEQHQGQTDRLSLEKKKRMMWSSLQFLPGLFLQVTSPLGDVLHHADKVSHGQFAFTTAESGIYLACFWTETLEKGMVVNLNLDWRTGIAAKDWDSIAKKEKLDVSTVPVILALFVSACGMWIVKRTSILTN